MRKFGFVVLVMIGMLINGCGEKQAAQSSPALQGIWRAVLQVPGGELPFHIRFDQNHGRPTALLVNGAEEAPVEELRQSGDSLYLELPSFDSRIAVKSDGMVLTGALTLIKRGGVPQVISLHAVAGDTFRFFPDSQPQVPDVSGRWEVMFTDDEGTASPAIGEFTQQGDRLRGTFLTPTGDYRFLAGQVHDSTLFLSCFDGAHAFLFKARLDSRNVLTGDFWSGTAWHEGWKARRNEAASLPDAESLTYLKPGYRKLEFSFPDLQGRAVALSDERFRGKVVIVQLAGSWCPNCHDETAFLVPFYEKYHPAGLEIIGLMYEHYTEFAAAARQVEKYRRRFGIGFPLLIAGTSDKNQAAETLPALNAVISFPTTIFIDKSGRVRRIHTGFSGPGTGAHYDQLVGEITRFTGKLLAE